MNMHFYSQCGEDRWVTEYLNGAHGVTRLTGTFCEVGAHDGSQFSNTKHFEERGWTGILVEADPYLAAQCVATRTSPVWCCAAGLGTHGLFYVNQEDRGLSGMEAAGKPMMTLVKRLDWLLAVSQLGDGVDLLSIDTEGTELEVWESIGAIRPRIVIMEYLTGRRPSKEKEILERMERDGYRLMLQTPFNLILERKI